MTRTPRGKERPDFSYRRGPVYTTKPWTQPTVEKFEQWLVRFKEYIRNHAIEIDVYLCGKFIEKIEDTWDIDIILSHRNLWSFSEREVLVIRDLMIYGMQLGHDEFGILVDMQCYLPNPVIGNGFWYSADDYLRHGQIETQKLDISIDEYFHGEKVSEYENAHKVAENLYLVTVECPSNKHVERIRNGQKYARPVLL
jgi:hypothetical protein